MGRLALAGTVLVRGGLLVRELGSLLGAGDRRVGRVQRFRHLLADDVHQPLEGLLDVDVVLGAGLKKFKTWGRGTTTTSGLQTPTPSAAALHPATRSGKPFTAPPPFVKDGKGWVCRTPGPPGCNLPLRPPSNTQFSPPGTSRQPAAGLRVCNKNRHCTPALTA